jgi:hypothetical protein
MMPRDSSTAQHVQPSIATVLLWRKMPGAASLPVPRTAGSIVKAMPSERGAQMSKCNAMLTVASLCLPLILAACGNVAAEGPAEKTAAPSAPAPAADPTAAKLADIEARMKVLEERTSPKALQAVFDAAMKEWTSQERVARCAAEIKQTANAVAQYRVKFDKYPATLAELKDIRVAVPENDPWGNPYTYSVEEDGFTIRSSGANAAHEADDIYWDSETNKVIVPAAKK